MGSLLLKHQGKTLNDKNMKIIERFSIKAIWIVALLCTYTTNAQEPSCKEVLNKLSHAYADAQTYSMKVEMEIYEKNSQKAPLQSFKGSVCKSSGQYYSEMMGRTMLSNQRCVLVVDDIQKRIMYSSKDKKERTPYVMSSSIESQVDSMIKHCKAVKLIPNSSTSNNSYRIEVTPSDNDPYYSSMTILVNRKTFALEQMECIYKESEEMPYNKVVIRYENISINAPVQDSFFQESKFILRSKGKITATAGYSSYEIINKDEIKTSKQ
jgi:outer membrane lipoprotein-sorting protein